MGGYCAFVGLAAVLPPLAGHGHHAHEHLGVHGAVGCAESAPGEFVGQDVFHAGRHVGEQGGEGAFGLGRRSIAHEDPEAVGPFLDVGQQGEGRPFHEDAGFGFLGQGVVDGVEQDPESRTRTTCVYSPSFEPKCS